MWGALGPDRLRCTITTGEIISKTAAADYTATLLGSHAPLLARAKACRLGDMSVEFTWRMGSRYATSSTRWPVPFHSRGHGTLIPDSAASGSVPGGRAGVAQW